jgi:hypothetical protein
VATDSDGKVWVVNYGEPSSSGSTGDEPGGSREEMAGPHYGYSDMTGIVAVP